jgi:sigma-B regulation protein RsbU (phosphoserine phosphatase)
MTYFQAESRRMLKAWFNKYPALFKAILLAYATLVLVSSINRIYDLSLTTTDENRFIGDTPKLRIVEVTKGGASDRAGMLVGDTLIAINGQTFKDANDADRILRQANFGEVMDYEIIRGGQHLTLKIQAARIGFNVIQAIGLTIGLLFLSLGLFVGLQRPANEIARLFAFGFVSFSTLMFLVSAANILNNFIFGTIVWIGFYVGLPMIIHVNYYIPRPNPMLEKRKPLIKAFYGFGVAGLLVALFEYLFPEIKTLVPLAVPLPAVVFIVAMIGMTIMQSIDSYRHGGKNRRIIDVSWMLFGTTFGIIGTFANAFPILLYLLLFTAGVPIAYFYVITRERLFDITVVVKRTIRYRIINFLFVFALFILYMTAVSYFSQIPFDNIGAQVTPTSIIIESGANRRPGFSDRPIFVFFGLGLFLFVALLKRRGQAGLDRWFSRQAYDYKRALSEVSEVIASRLKLDDLAKEIAAEIKIIMRLRSVMIYLRRGDDFVLQADTASSDEQPSKAANVIDPKLLYAQVAELMMPVPVEDTTAKNVMRQSRIQFIVPIILKDKQIGVFLLGEKLSEEVYRKDDIEFIESLARQVAVAFENTRLSQEESEKRRLKRELAFASEVQQELLPKKVPVVTGLEAAGFYASAGEVGGDYYDFLNEPATNGTSNALTVIVGDVSGKGVSAAMYMSRIQGIVRSLAFSGIRSPKLLLQQTNRLVYSDQFRKSYVTMLVARFETQARTLSLVRAGHLPLFWYSQKLRECRIVRPSGLGVGLDSGDVFDKNLVEQKIQYEDGDVFVMVSDGVTEAVSITGEEFGDERLQTVLYTHAQESATDISQAIQNAIIDFVGNADQHDDITILVIKATPQEKIAERFTEPSEHNERFATTVEASIPQMRSS